MIKGQIFIAGRVIYSAYCFIGKDFTNVNTLEESHDNDPLVTNVEFGGCSQVNEVSLFQTYTGQPITNDMVIDRLAKKNQTAANDLILKQVRLDLCFSHGYRHIWQTNAKKDAEMRIKSKHFTDARNKALLSLTWK